MLKKLVQGSVAGLLLSLASVSQAGLLGQDVTVTGSGGFLGGLADTVTVINPGIEIAGGGATNIGGALFAGEFIDILDASISMVFDLAIGENGMLEFTGLNAGGFDVIGAALSAADERVAVSFTESSVLFDATEWFSIGGAGNFTIDILFDGAQVPVPATLALFGLGLAGLGFSRRRVQQ